MELKGVLAQSEIQAPQDLRDPEVPPVQRVHLESRDLLDLKDLMDSRYVLMKMVIAWNKYMWIIIHYCAGS